MSKSLIKLLDNSIVPASTMVVAKFLGLVLAIRLFNIPWTIKDYTNSLFNLTTIIKKEDIAVVTSYSDLIMFLAVALFLALNVVRAIYLHNTHLKPEIILKLRNRNLLNLVTGSYEIYHSTLMWWVFSWIANILVLVDMFTERTYLWIALVCTITSLVLTFLLAQDIYKEIENIRRHPANYKWQ